MKCKKCNAEFSKKLIVNDVQRILGNRTSCFNCVPYIAEKTKQIYHDKSKVPEVDEIQCKICGKIRELKSSKIGLYSKICNSCMVNTRRFAVIQKLKNLLGAKCSKCGYDKCQSALAFHHLDPKEKKFTISSAFCRKWDTLEKEVMKCILLCANCHIEFHNDSSIKKFILENPDIITKTEKYPMKKKPRGVCLYCRKELIKLQNKYCSSKCYNKNRHK